MHWTQVKCSCGHRLDQHYYHNPATDKLLDKTQVLPPYIDVRGCEKAKCKCMEFDNKTMKVPDDSVAHDVIKTQREAYLESIGT